MAGALASVGSPKGFPSASRASWTASGRAPLAFPQSSQLTEVLTEGITARLFATIFRIVTVSLTRTFWILF